jgi:hypothetical protein
MQFDHQRGLWLSRHQRDACQRLVRPQAFSTGPAFWHGGAAPPAEPTVILYDTFTGADATLLQNHVGEVNANWSWDNNYGGISNTLVELNSNDLRLKPTAAWRDEQYIPSGQLPVTGDWTLEAGFRVLAGDYNFANVRTGSNQQYGPALIEINAENTASGSYVKFWGGVRHNPAANQFALATDLVAKVVKTGSIYTYFVGAAQVGSTVDASADFTPEIYLNLGGANGSVHSLSLTHLKVTVP